MLKNMQHQTLHEYHLTVDTQEWDLQTFIIVVTDNSPFYINDCRNALVVHVSRAVSGVDWLLHSCLQHPRVSVYGLEEVGHSYRQNNYKIVASGDVVMGRSPFFSYMFTADASDDDKVYKIQLEKHGASRSFISMFGSKAELDETDIKLIYNPSAYPSEYKVSNLPTPDQTLRGLQTLLVLRQVSNNKEFCIIRPGSNSAIDIGVPLSFQSMTKYEARVYVLETSWQKDRIHGHKISTSSNILKFGTYMTQQNLETLKKRAVMYFCHSGDQLVPLTEFWRNKPKSYFDDIMKNRDGVMEKYRKDYNGDQSSWLNGNMDGLFFSAALDRNTHQIPTFSFFGNTRFHVPVDHLFNDDHNLYFADFYCLRKIHYVTLILTKKGSQADLQCQSRLLLLDMYRNPFLRMEKLHSFECLMQRLTLTHDYRSSRASRQSSACTFTVYTTVALPVEVFYTEDIDICGLQRMNPRKFYFTYVATRGRGSSRPRGIPKNSTCTICNI